MPIQFEEVTGEIAPEPAGASAPAAPPPQAKPAADLSGQIESALRMLEERHARLCAD